MTEIHDIQKQAILKEMDKDIEKIDEIEKKEPPRGVQLIEKSKKMKSNENNDAIENSKSESNDIEKNNSDNNSKSNITNENDTSNIYDDNNDDGENSII